MSTSQQHPQQNQPANYIGLMSGTSMDGVDGVVLAPIDERYSVLAHIHKPFSQSLKQRLLALNTVGVNELHLASLAANDLALLYAQVVSEVMKKAGLSSEEIRVIGAHGQTVRHCPSGSMVDGGGYTIQLNNPALLAERTGIDVVADFRSRDVAAGGQGAPLVPLFHQAMFSQLGMNVAVLNIGGIANVSLLHADGRVEGFDTGPGNMLLDAWIMQQKSLAYDADGAWAASGRMVQSLFNEAFKDAYFSKPLPKSTGRDDFNSLWLQKRLNSHADFALLSANDVQATLVELTVRSIAQALEQHAKGFTHLYVCGGGALNKYLMRQLQISLPQMSIQLTDAIGIPVMQVEAAAFAWLAKQCIDKHALNLEKITGAGLAVSPKARVLGAIYTAA